MWTVADVLIECSLGRPVALFGVLGAVRAYLPPAPQVPGRPLRQQIAQYGVATVLADHRFAQTLAQ
jgi:hypothetical protein